MFRDEVSPTGDGGRDDYPSVSLRDPAPLTRGARFFLRKGALIHRHAEVMRALQANKKPSEKKLFPGRFKFVSFRQTGICFCVTHYPHSARTELLA